MGMLTKTGDNRMTGASVALRILVEARRDGVSDDEIILRSPAVLALTPPRVGPGPELPPEARPSTSAATPRTPTTTGSCGRRCACGCAGSRRSPGGRPGPSASG